MRVLDMAIVLLPLEEEVGDQETQKAKSSNDLDGNTASRCLLHTQAGCSSRDSLLGILVDGISLSLAQSLIISFLAHSCDSGLCFGKFGLHIVGRSGDGVDEALSSRGIRVGRSVSCWVSGRVDGISEVLVVNGTFFRARDGTHDWCVGASLGCLRLRGDGVEGSDRVVHVAANTSIGDALWGQEDNADLLLLNRRLCCLLNVRPLVLSVLLWYIKARMERTICETLGYSLSAEMATDWTRNLSLHFASRGGSSLMACNKTESWSVVCFSKQRPRAQRTLNLDILTRLNATRVWSDTVSVQRLVEEECKWSGEADCLGAVVLT